MSATDKEDSNWSCEEWERIKDDMPKGELYDGIEELIVDIRKLKQMVRELKEREKD